MDILNKRYKEVYERSKASGSTSQEIQRYMFLDIDGVLNTIRYSNYLIDHDEDDVDEDGAIFDPDAVDNLAYIIERVPDVKIIISSTWRFKGWDWMNQMWEKRKMPGRIFTFTPALDIVCFKDLINHRNSQSTFPYGVKGLEINEWLRNNVKMGDPYYYAILDDEVDYLATHSDYAVLCNPQNGLTRKKADKIIEILHPSFAKKTKVRPHIELSYGQYPFGVNYFEKMDNPDSNKVHPFLQLIAYLKKKYSAITKMFC